MVDYSHLNGIDRPVYAQKNCEANDEVGISEGFDWDLLKRFSIFCGRYW
jgi:hypothetical protein